MTTSSSARGSSRPPTPSRARRSSSRAATPGTVSHRAPLAAALAREGLGVLLFDYRGYGTNRGRPTQRGLARDVRAARRFLTDEAGVPPDQILHYGESLGSAVVTELATEHPPAALVLRSPFPDLATVGRVHYPFLPVRLLLRDRYPLAEQLARVDVPTTIVYGADDAIVPAQLSRAVAASAAGPPASSRSSMPITTTARCSMGPSSSPRSSPVYHPARAEDDARRPRGGAGGPRGDGRGGDLSRVLVHWARRPAGADR
jgi:pimeloyl-ACP methyl ester carboxylesterase